jgi:solute carrier family 13 (sodium-dependent dicarboxylate transporter), member 2/3/5
MPPNALVFGSGYLTIPRMARAGFLLDLLAACLVALWGFTGVRWILS